MGQALDTFDWSTQLATIGTAVSPGVEYQSGNVVPYVGHDIDDWSRSIRVSGCIIFHMCAVKVACA